MPSLLPSCPLALLPPCPPALLPPILTSCPARLLADAVESFIYLYAPAVVTATGRNWPLGPDFSHSQALASPAGRGTAPNWDTGEAGGGRVCACVYVSVRRGGHLAIFKRRRAHARDTPDNITLIGFPPHACLQSTPSAAPS